MSTSTLSQQFEESLPVDDARAEFDEAIETGRPMVVVAPTGSGKSTRLPLWLADGCDDTVLVVEPRRVACRSLATYLSKIIGESVGQTIGYRVRFDDSTSKNTKIIFVTTGVALQMLAGDDVDRFGAVLIDEFHERGWEVDLLGAVLLDALERGDYDAPLIFTSATVDAVEIADQIDAEVVEAEGRTYPVDISYRGDKPAPTKDGLDGRVKSTVEDVIGEEEDGDILVFLPGKGEISDCESALKSTAHKHNLEVIAVHGRLPTRYLTRAFSEHGGKRRVFLSTNVAETSLTLPGVTTVIDSGLVRMMIHRGGRAALAMVPISLDSMDQRAGRAGRVRPGRCIRLWSQRFTPDEETRPEIERIELDDVILKAALCGLDGPRFDEAIWLTDPPEFAVDKARRRLRRMGAIGDDDRLTDKGRRMGDLPVGGDEARVLLDPPDELKSTVADLVALVQIGRDLLLRKHLIRGSFDDVKEARTELLTGTKDEVYVQLRCLRHGDPNRHGLHGGALKEARRIASSLRRRLGVPPPDPQSDHSGLPDPERLAEYLLERIPESAFVVRKRALKYRNDGKAKRGSSEPWGNGELELSVWPFEPPVSERVQKIDKHPVAGLVLDHFWLGNSGIGVRGTGRMVLPCTYDQLLEAGIGEDEISDIRAGTRHGTPYVRGVVERSHAGVVLRRQEESLRGDALLEAAANAILEERILQPAGKLVLDDLHVWSIMARWPRRAPERNWSGDTSPPDPLEFVIERLDALGVESDQDLMLVEAEDLRPDVKGHMETYQYEIDNLAEDFPRIWEHQSRRYTCDVTPATRTVVLEPVTKKTARAGDPKARYLPRFRGFDVKYKNASRTVPIRSR